MRGVRIPDIVAAASLGLRALSATTPLTMSHGIRTFDPWDGMPYFAVSGLAATPDGCLWLATYGDLVRFDGVKFEPLGDGVSPGLGRLQVTVVEVDGRGRLWVGGGGGLVGVMDGKAWKWYGQQEGVPEAGLQDVEVMGNGEAWLATKEGLLREREGRFVGVPLPDGGSAGDLRLAAEKDGRLWCVSRTGLWRRDGEGWFRQGLPAGAEGLVLCGMGLARDGGLWVAWADRVWRLRGDAWDAPRRRPEGHQGDPVTVLEDGEGGLWLGGLSTGLTWFPPGGGEAVAKGRSGLGGSSVTSLLDDGAGGVWVGMNGGFVSRVRRRALQHAGAEQGLGYAANSVAEEEPGVLLVGTHGGGLMRWHDGKLARHPLAGGEVGEGAFVTAVCRDKGGDLWAGTWNDGLFHGRDGRWERISAADTGAQMIRALHEDARGRLWVGTAAGIAVREEGRFRVMDGKDSAPRMVVSGFGEDTAGGIWACGIGHGVFRWDGTRFARQELPGHPDPKSVACLAAGRDGSMWVGLRHVGVARIRDGKARLFGEGEGLVVGDSVALIEDEEGQLWVWTDDRCQRVPVGSFDKVEAEGGGRLDVRTFGRRDGFPGAARTGLHPVAWRGRAGRLWWATANGLAEANVGTLPRQVEAPGVAWRWIREGGRERNVASVRETTVDLGRPGGDMELAFRADRFRSPETVRYETRLLPRGGWQSSMGETRIPVRDLVAGRYELEVRTSEREGEWGRPSVVRFEIPAALWQQEWFVGLSIASSAGAAVTVARWIAAGRMRRRLLRLEQDAMLERERVRIARNLHDDLGANVTHLGLLLQRMHGVTDLPCELLRLVGEGLDVTRRTKGSLDAAVWAVNPARDTLGDLVGYLAQTAWRLCEGGGMELALDLPEEVPDRALGAEWRHNVVMVAKEATHNAIKHSGGTALRLRVALEGNGLRVEVCDNGRGMGPGNGSSPGNGHVNMRQRVAAMGGIVEIHGPAGAGTSVRAFFPWQRTT